MEDGAKRSDLEDRTFRFAESVRAFVQRLSTRSGERRLLACGRRQLADDTRALQRTPASNVQRAFRQAAEKDRLAACAPQIGAFRKPK
jgi:hypothetical protein